jgi:hypothetical protein
MSRDADADTELGGAVGGIASVNACRAARAPALSEHQLTASLTAAATTSSI